ncbi:MAG: GNAT family N-acetyltransferase [Faecousia sp.]
MSDTQVEMQFLIREYDPSDCEQIAQLFYQTVHSVNADDYTREQLDAWASGCVDLTEWNASFLRHFTVVAVKGQMVVGFGDMDPSGYLDRLYVHKDYQNQGIATAICNVLEQAVDADSITTHASITAKRFFAHRGYHMVKEQQVIRKGVSLTNFVMEKGFREPTPAA